MRSIGVLVVVVLGGCSFDTSGLQPFVEQTTSVGGQLTLSSTGSTPVVEATGGHIGTSTGGSSVVGGSSVASSSGQLQSTTGSGGVEGSGDTTGLGGTMGSGGKTGSGGTVVSTTVVPVGGSLDVGHLATGGEAGATGPVEVGGASGSTGTTGAPDAGAPDLVVEVPVADTRPTPDIQPPANMLVTFMDDVAQGGMSGPGWVALGASDVLLYPICLRQTGTDRCNADGWDSTTNLCASAYLPSTSSPIAEDNWGLEIGADVASPNAPLGRSYGSISVIFTGKPSSNLRIVLHRSGDPATTTYCQDQVQSGSSYHLTGFNTLCQDGSGAQFAVSDAALIDQIGLQVTASTSAIAVSNLCLGSIMLTQ